MHVVCKVMKAATKFTIMFQRSKMEMLDVTDDNAERPWDHAYVHLPTYAPYSCCITIINSLTFSVLGDFTVAIISLL